MKSNLRYGIRQVIFTGGEPTLRPDLIELISYGHHELGLETHLQTNGRLLAYKSFCQDLVVAGLDYFGVAVHGHNPSLHDYLSNCTGSFQQAVSAMQNLARLRQKFITNTVITKQNYRHLSDIAKMVLCLGAQKYQFIFPHVSGEAYINRKIVLVKMKQVVPFARDALQLGIKFKRSSTIKAIPFCLLKDCDSHIRRSIYPDEKYVFFKDEADCSLWKGERCKRCSYNEKCEGVWQVYPRLFGTEEFVPVT